MYFKSTFFLSSLSVSLRYMRSVTIPIHTPPPHSMSDTIKADALKLPEGLGNPQNDDRYIKEVADLLQHPVTRITVLATNSEGADGTWGTEIRFTLVSASHVVARKQLRNVRDILRRCETAPSLAFPHTMRTVKVIPGWHVSTDIGGFPSSLIDIRFTRGGLAPPLSQAQSSLMFCRHIARCIRRIRDLHSDGEGIKPKTHFLSSHETHSIKKDDNGLYTVPSFRHYDK